jgi:hypothetical protein
MAEILAGRAEGHGGIDRGRAHLFHGEWIVSQLPQGAWPSGGGAVVITPPPPPDKDHGVPYAYETLIDWTDNPNGSDHTAFGLNVFMLRKDVGPAGATWPDGQPDIAIYSDKANFYGSPAAAAAGALWVFFNDYDLVAHPGSLVDEEGGVKLQAPTASGGPKTNARFGFCAATINWASTQGGNTVLADYLLVGEPQATYPSVPAKGNAGRVFMFALPLDPGLAPGSIASVQTLGAPPPDGPQAEGQFGYWIGVGDYNGNTGFFGEEFIVGERGKDVNGFSKAGQAHSYRSGG